MPRARSPDRDKARKIYIESEGLAVLKDIAGELGLQPSQIRKWKSQDKWDDDLKSNVTNKKKSSVTNKKRNKKGAPLNNKNAVGHGAPAENKNAEKHGLFTKYLPEETLELIKNIEIRSPIDILWDQIKLQYAAIIRSQQIMYVKDKEDKTTTKIEEKDGNVWGEKWDVQQAWDKQATFLKAQSRAMGELRSLIRQYDVLLKTELATEEQQLRIQKLKVEITAISGEGEGNNQEAIDNFLEATSKSEKEIKSLFEGEADEDI